MCNNDNGGVSMISQWNDNDEERNIEKKEE